MDTIRLVVLRLRPAARRATPAAAGRRHVVSSRVGADADDALLARRVLTAVAELAGARATRGTVGRVDVDDATRLPAVPAGLEARPVASPTGHTDAVESVAVGELDGTPIAVSGGDDGTVRVWDLTRYLRQ